MPPVAATRATTASRASLHFADPISLPSRQRNRERERTAGARGALHLDAAAVGLDCQLAEGETETGASPSRIELTELLEDSLERCVRNSDPRIADREPDVLRAVRRRDDRHCSCFCELDGIGDEIHECATQHAFVTRKARKPGGDLSDERSVRFLSER